MLLVIDVGNTNITLGVFDGEEVKRNLPHDDQTEPALRMSTVFSCAICWNTVEFPKTR